MKKIQLFFLMSLALESSYLRASDDESSPGINNRWKVDFFREYMAEYKELREPNHAAIAQVLQNSFAKTAGEVPDKDKKLAAGVADQIQFFVKLKNPETISIEVQKCSDGMKTANSFIVKMLPRAAKADRFVDRFYAEYKRRMQGDADDAQEDDEE